RNSRQRLSKTCSVASGLMVGHISADRRSPGEPPRLPAIKDLLYANGSQNKQIRIALAGYVHWHSAHVRCGVKADICSARRHVRFTPESGQVRCNEGCPLWAKNSEHHCYVRHIPRKMDAVASGDRLRLCAM